MLLGLAVCAGPALAQVAGAASPAPLQAMQAEPSVQSISSFALKTGVSGLEVKSLRVAEPVAALPGAGPKGAKHSGERTQDLQVELAGGYAAQKMWVNEMLARYPRLGVVQWDMQRQEASPLQGRLTLRLRLEPKP